MPSREALQNWALEHPEERLAGLIGLVEPAEWGDFARLPVWPASGLALAGYDDLGRQVRVSWFEHFRFDGAADAEPLPPATVVAPPDIELRAAWRLHDPQIEADAIAFWNRLNILPRNVIPHKRAKELVLAAYRDGRIVGVVTAEVGVLPQVRARVAMLRVAIDPELRRRHVGLAMFVDAPRILGRWSAEHPHERLAGVGGIVESPLLMAGASHPRWPGTMDLIGFTPDGRQIRVGWFEDFRLDLP